MNAAKCLVNLETAEILFVSTRAVEALGVRPPWKDITQTSDAEKLQLMMLTATVGKEGQVAGEEN